MNGEFQLETPDGGHLECLVRGSGRPVTVFAHGLGATIADTRPFASGITGTKVFFHFRGHGNSSAPTADDVYFELAADLDLVATHTNATRAFGVSLGAAALTRLLVDQPDRFDRFACYLPAVLDQPRADVAAEHAERFIRYVDDHDPAGLAVAMLADLPAELRDMTPVVEWMHQRARDMVGTSISLLMRRLIGRAPIVDGTALAKVSAPALIVAQRGDDMHPLDVAEQLAEVLPNATLVVYDVASAFWQARVDLRERITDFYN